MVLEATPHIQLGVICVEVKVDSMVPNYSSYQLRVSREGTGASHRALGDACGECDGC